MTLQDLNEHWRRLQRIRENDELLQTLRESIAPGGQVLTGMPHAPGVKDNVGSLAAEIADLDAENKELRAEISAAEPEILEFIRTIDDGKTRVIFRLRFIRGMSWGEVASTIGGWTTESTVKRKCYRVFSPDPDEGARE